MDRLKNRAFFWIVWAASLVLFMVPFSMAQADGIGLDKLYHLMIFGVLMFLAVHAFSKSKIQTLLFISAYALAVELIQGWLLPWRAFDMYDLLAGVTGALVVFLSELNEFMKVVIDPSPPRADGARLGGKR